jgi:hypothetical protein
VAFNATLNVSADMPPGTILGQVNGTDRDVPTFLEYNLRTATSAVSVHAKTGVITALRSFVANEPHLNMSVDVSDGAQSSAAHLSLQVVTAPCDCEPLDACHPSPTCTFTGICSAGAPLPACVQCECPASSAAGLAWPAAPCGERAVLRCPGSNRAGFIYRQCGSNGQFQDPVPECINQDLLSLSMQSLTTDQDAATALQTLLNVTEESEYISSFDLVLASSVYADLVGVMGRSPQSALNLVNDVFQSASQLMDVPASLFAGMPEANSFVSGRVMKNGKDGGGGEEEK